MAKRVRQAQVTLLEKGVLDETLHYRLYSLVGHSNNPYLLGYTCQSDAFYTKVPVHDSSTAISSIYTSQIKIFVFGIRLSSREDWNRDENNEHFNINKYSGIQLFGLDYIVTQQLIKQHRIPTYKPNQWRDFSPIKALYNYHVK
ncbi:2641_t:CDS:2 [Scutellospora calospora]|uniref:2641_t:CDS:1 n=1 Tax=Scutellospora calospora TaxID=85575 RepID=A0ACA9LX21_9GLOM|nr:2641_t:CDS:2 [Scutellospora calospora]